MKIVMYMLRKFFSIFFGAMVFVVLILCIMDLLINLWNYMSKGVPWSVVGKIIYYYVPKTVWYAVPISMLFATAYMLSDFYAKNELLAIFASGISLFKFSFPLLIVGFFMSFGLFVFEDNIVVPTYAKKNKLQSQALQKEKSLDNDRIVIMADGGNIIYKAAYYNDQLSSLKSLWILVRNDSKDFKELIFAEEASWIDDCWELSKPVVYRKIDGEIKNVPYNHLMSKRFVEPPETFRNNTISVEEVNTREARQYISHLEKAGLPVSEAKSVYYKKYSFPFVVFIVVFLAVGLSGKTRKNVLIISLALSVIAVVLFYVLQMITMLMAKFGAIPPVFGAWFPVVFFVFASSVLLKYART